MRFELVTASRIIFGAGTLGEAGTLARGLGRRALVVTGRTPSRAQPLLAVLREHGVSAVTFSVSGEPDVEAVRSGKALGKKEQCDHVIGFGGGGAVDTAKAVAAMLTNPGDVLDYLELVGRGQTLTAAPLPWLAIPTTAGTG
jgi:alcohol dehydrogenase class IV